MHKGASPIFGTGRVACVADGVLERHPLIVAVVSQAALSPCRSLASLGLKISVFNTREQNRRKKVSVQTVEQINYSQTTSAGRFRES